MSTFGTPTEGPHGIGRTLVRELDALGALDHGSTIPEYSERSR